MKTIAVSGGFDPIHVGHLRLFEEAKARVERDYLQESAKMYADLWLRALKERAIVKRHLFPEPPAPEPVQPGPRDEFPLPK